MMSSHSSTHMNIGNSTTNTSNKSKNSKDAQMTNNTNQPLSTERIHAISKSKNNIKLASLATTTRSVNTHIASTHIDNKQYTGGKSLSSSLHSYYNKFLSSVMLDLGGKVQQLTSTVQKNKISESRLALINDDCYKVKYTPPTISDGDRLILEQENQILNSNRDNIIMLSQNKKSYNNQDLIRDHDNQDSLIKSNNLPIYNDCQPLLKNAPRYKIYDQQQQQSFDDIGASCQPVELLHNKSNSSISHLSRVKYSIESLEYRRHLDHVVQNSFISRNMASASVCTTMLWVMAIHIILLNILTGGALVQGSPVAAANQLLLYSPTMAVEPATGNIQAGTTVSMASANPSSSQAIDFEDDGSDLDIMSGQQQIPTAHLLSAAGHIVPENYFGPGSVPLAYTSQSSPQQDQLQSASSERDAINNVNNQQVASGASKQASNSNMGQQPENAASYIDYNGYNLATQPEHDSVNQADIIDFGPSNAAYYTIYNGENSMPQGLHINLQDDHLMGQDSIGSQIQYNQVNDNQVMSQALDGGEYIPIVGSSNPSPSSSGSGNIYSSNNINHKQRGHQKYGQPTRVGTVPRDLLTLNQGSRPNAVSSPVIDAISTMPKVNVQHLSSKIPQLPTSQFSFSSNKDPMEKVKSVNQKKRTMMRQAEQLAKMMIDSVNKKFGTTIGDQSDIPFVLSTLGPLGFAQNLLFDPSFLITLLHSTEKGYLSDVLPTPAKMIIRPVLNAFRMPNKKKDKGNLLNVISYISSGLQSPTGLQPNHRQGSAGKRTGARKY